MSDGKRPTAFELAVKATEAAEARARALGQFKRGEAPTAKPDDGASWVADTPVNGDPPTLRAVRLTAASSIMIRPVRWLQHERIPLGSLTLLGGREGIGKSLVSSWLAAAITRGRLPGEYEGQPKSVIVAATEDSWAHTIVPRLMAAGADLDKVFRVDVTTYAGVDTSVSLPRDLPDLEGAVRDVDAALILLDPLMSRLDSHLDTHKDAEVRLALEPLTAVADRTGVTILGLIHVNKTTSTDPLTTLMASRAFAAVARAVLFVMTDPDDDAVRLLGEPKNNLGRTDLPTATFRVESAHVADTDEGPVWTGRIKWLGEVDRSIRDVMRDAEGGNDAHTAIGEASDWLEDYLAGTGGTDDSSVIKREGAKLGHSKDALHRARKRLKLTTESSGFPRKTYWTLPDSSAGTQSATTVVAARGESATTTTTNTTGQTGQQLLQWSELLQSSGPPEAVATTVGALNPDGPPARCTVCGKVLAPLLVENGYTAHPTCSEQAAS